jgi:hypothetical protein
MNLGQPSACLIGAPDGTESTCHAVVPYQITVLHNAAWADNAEREKNLHREKSNAFTNMPCYWIELQGRNYPLFLSTP